MNQYFIHSLELIHEYLNPCRLTVLYKDFRMCLKKLKVHEGFIRGFPNYQSVTRIELILFNPHIIFFFYFQRISILILLQMIKPNYNIISLITLSEYKYDKDISYHINACAFVLMWIFLPFTYIIHHIIQVF